MSSTMHGQTLIKLEILLETETNNVEVLCFTEHWLNCHKTHAININYFTLANAFCRRNSIFDEYFDPQKH